MRVKKRKRTVAGVLCLGMLLQTAAYMPANADDAAQVTINEVCPDNDSYAAPDGKKHDWIELYNSGKTAADISGWALSDKADQPKKYVFPSGTQIPAEGRLVVFCDSDAAANDNRIAPFGISASGETLVLTDSNGRTAQTITFGYLAKDTSYGQYPEGSGQYYTVKSTPGKANEAPEGSNAVHAPSFSHDSGFYDSSFKLTLTADPGCDIYYTTDGSDPVYGSAQYTAPLTIEDMTNTKNRLSARTDIVPDGAEAPRGNVDKAVIIRAVAVKDGIASEYITKTYFLGKTNSGYYKDMKVVSLVTDPANLFDKDKGIYCLGKEYEQYNGGQKNPWDIPANYRMKGKEWERPAHVTFFENGKQVLDQNIGIRIKGAFSRCIAQKSFNLYTRKEYGKPELEYDFFSGKATKAKNGKAIKEYDGLVIRNGGNDNTGAFFRDSINQTLVADRSFATQANTECIVFIDGEFWGIYQMMEKINRGYLSSHYGVKKDSIAMIENGALEEGNDNDLRDWRSLCDGIANGSLSYEEISDKLDIQGFIDYFAAQIYWCNADWPQNNFSAWRSNENDETNPYADGKWRMILFDTESGQGLYGTEDKSYSADQFSRIRNSSNQLARVFNGLMNYQRFRHRFARTMMDLTNKNFTPERTKEVINFYRNTYKQQVTDTFTRFHSGSLSGENAARRFEGDMNTVTEFYDKRYTYAERTTRSAMGLSSEPNRINIKNDPNGGSININTLTLGKISNWSGRYHSDYDITVTAQPVDGKYFSHWNINGAEITDGDKNSASIKLKLTSDASVEAVYGNGAAPAVQTTASTVSATTTTTTTTRPATTTTVTTTKPIPQISNRPGKVSTGTIINAETFDIKEGIENEPCSEGGQDVAYIEDGEYIAYKNFDLSGAGKIDFRIGSTGAKAVLEVRLDAPDGKLIGKMDIKSSGGWQTWNTQSCNIEKTSGKHDLYFVFTGGEGYLFNINWWRTDSPVKEHILGDINSDGVVDVFDLCMEKNAAANGWSDNFAAADVNGDDTINDADVELVRAYIMGQIKSF